MQEFNKEHAKENLKEVSNFRIDQMRYDPIVESLTDFLTKLKKTAKQAGGDKASKVRDVSANYPLS